VNDKNERSLKRKRPLSYDWRGRANHKAETWGGKESSGKKRDREKKSMKCKAILYTCARVWTSKTEGVYWVLEGGGICKLAGRRRTQYTVEGGKGEQETCIKGCQ